MGRSWWISSPGSSWVENCDTLIHRPALDALNMAVFYRKRAGENFSELARHPNRGVQCRTSQSGQVRRRGVGGIAWGFP